MGRDYLLNDQNARLVVVHLDDENPPNEPSIFGVVPLDNQRISCISPDRRREADLGTYVDGFGSQAVLAII